MSTTHLVVDFLLMAGWLATLYGTRKKEQPWIQWFSVTAQFGFLLAMFIFDHKSKTWIIGFVVVYIVGVSAGLLVDRWRKARATSSSPPPTR